MRCVECGAESKYHRAVVELVTGTVLGSYCVTCERRRFDDGLDAPAVDDSCVSCDRPGHYLLPVHEVDIDLTADEESVEMGWRNGGAPRLCFDHLLELATPSDLARRRRRGVAWPRR
ncbi:hypothetical protein [Haloplanus halophilus]|uniref:hypothetical protein n=1 Tax=Haloplanus halophilus TaxID=2949993 RepID=UPI00203EDA7A|nr:hypothetical protein [Haloplanus sp. GDY1]